MAEPRDCPESSILTLARLRERIEAALELRWVGLYRYAALRLHAREVTRDDALALLQQSVPVYTVTAFEPSNWPVIMPPPCRAIIEGLPEALADLTVGCALAAATAQGGKGTLESLVLGGDRGLVYRPAEIRVEVRPGRAHCGDRPCLLIGLAPSSPPRSVVAAASCVLEADFSSVD